MMTMNKLLARTVAVAVSAIGLIAISPSPDASAATRTTTTAPRAVKGYVGTPTSKSPRLDTRCLTKGTVICINKTTHRLYYLKDGKVVDDFSVRTGRRGLDTREGTFRVEWKARTLISNLYHVPMPFSMFFSGGQAVHYSADFAANGYGVGSHGCANLRDWAGARMMFDNTPVGSKVVVYH